MVHSSISTIVLTHGVILDSVMVPNHLPHVRAIPLVAGPWNWLFWAVKRSQARAHFRANGEETLLTFVDGLRPRLDVRSLRSDSESLRSVRRLGVGTVGAIGVRREKMPVSVGIITV